MARMEAREAQISARRDVTLLNIAKTLKELEGRTPEHQNEAATASPTPVATTASQDVAVPLQHYGDDLSPDWISMSESTQNGLGDLSAADKAKVRTRQAFQSLRSATSVSAIHNRLLGRSKSRAADLAAVRCYDDSEQDLLAPIAGTKSYRFSTPSNGSSIPMRPLSSRISIPASSARKSLVLDPANLKRQFSPRKAPDSTGENASLETGRPNRTSDVYQQSSAFQSSTMASDTPLPAAFARRVNRQVDAINQMFSTQINSRAPFRNSVGTSDFSQRSRMSISTATSDDRFGLHYSSAGSYEHPHESERRRIEGNTDPAKLPFTLRGTSALNWGLQIQPKCSDAELSISVSPHRGLKRSHSAPSLSKGSMSTCKICFVHQLTESKEPQGDEDGAQIDGSIEETRQAKPRRMSLPTLSSEMDACVLANIETLRKVTPPYGQYSDFDPSVPVPKPLAIRKYSPLDGAADRDAEDARFSLEPDATQVTKFDGGEAGAVIGLGIKLGGDHVPTFKRQIADTPTRRPLRHMASNATVLSWDGFVNKILSAEGDSEPPKQPLPSSKLSISSPGKPMPPDHDSPQITSSESNLMPEKAITDEDPIEFSRPLSSSDLLLTLAKQVAATTESPDRDEQLDTKMRDFAFTLGNGNEQELSRTAKEISALVENSARLPSEGVPPLHDNQLQLFETFTPHTPRPTEGGKNELTTEEGQLATPSAKWNSRFASTPQSSFLAPSPLLGTPQISSSLNSPSIHVEGIGQVVYNKVSGELGLESPHRQGDVSDVFAVHPAFRVSPPDIEGKSNAVAISDKDDTHKHRRYTSSGSGSSEVTSVEEIISCNSSVHTSPAIQPDQDISGDVVCGAGSAWPPPRYMVENNNARSGNPKTPDTNFLWITSGQCSDPNITASSLDTYKRSRARADSDTLSGVQSFQHEKDVQSVENAVEGRDHNASEEVTSTIVNAGNLLSPASQAHDYTPTSPSGTFPSLSSTPSFYAGQGQWSNMSTFKFPSPLPGSMRTTQPYTNEPSINPRKLAPTSNEMTVFRRKTHNLEPIILHSESTDPRIHPRHAYAWTTTKLHCLASHEGQCAICNAGCCVQYSLISRLENGMAELMHGGSKKAIAALEILQQASSDGIDAFKVMVTCTGCGRSVCPRCAGVCPVVMCGDVVCKICETGVVMGMKWQDCSWHDEQTGGADTAADGGADAAVDGGLDADGGEDAGSEHVEAVSALKSSTSFANFSGWGGRAAPAPRSESRLMLKAQAAENGGGSGEKKQDGFVAKMREKYGEKGEKSEKVEKGDKVEKAEKAEKVEKVEKAERAENGEKGDKV